MEIKEIPVGDLIPNPDNVNRMDKRTFSALVDEIRENGFLIPINVVPSEEDGRYLIMGGEHRWRAAKHLGFTEISCVLLTDAKWRDKDLFDLVSFRLNSIKGSQDPEKFMVLYKRMTEKYGSDKIRDVFAVTDDSLWKKLTKNVQKTLVDAGVSPSVAASVADARGADQITTKINSILRKHSESANESGNTLIVHGGGTTMVVVVSAKVFSVLAEIKSDADSRGQNFSEALEQRLMLS